MADNPLNVRVHLQSLDDQLGGETGETRGGIGFGRCAWQGVQEI